MQRKIGQLAAVASAATMMDPACAGILLVLARIRDKQKFGAYVQTLPPVYQQFGGQYLALAPAPSAQLSGLASAGFEPVSVVVSIWPSLERIKQFWNSEEYQSVAKLRAGTGDFMVAALEAVPGPELAAQLAQPQHRLALLLDPKANSLRHPSEGGDPGSIDAPNAIASGLIHALEGQFPGTTVWLGWQANALNNKAAIRFDFAKLAH